MMGKCGVSPARSTVSIRHTTVAAGESALELRHVPPGDRRPKTFRMPGRVAIILGKEKKALAGLSVSGRRKLAPNQILG